jgi:hypothetical protein
MQDRALSTSPFLALLGPKVAEGQAELAALMRPGADDVLQMWPEESE